MLPVLWDAALCSRHGIFCPGQLETEAVGAVFEPGEAMSVIRFEVYGKPEPQGSSRAFVNKATGRAVVTSANPALKDWREQVAGEARAKMIGFPPLEGAVTVGVVFWLARPASVKRTRPTVKPDLDKLVRAILDGLTGVAYRDDAQVVTVSAEKRYCDPYTMYPCAAVTVEEFPA